MTKMNNNYLNELNQIRRRQTDVLDAIDRIKERHQGEELAEIEEIQGEALKIVTEIDEIRERVQNERQTQGSTAEDFLRQLSRMKPPIRKVEIYGGVRV